ncbi:MAG: threonine ammonia-lyase [Methanomicrobiales archaeon]|nr:threonine ammonia-lyase [Methanomicrobiales archaeon]MDI6875169.1 threonine ammonia-lyase [Methanomicrobiales archaeon]
MVSLFDIQQAAWTIRDRVIRTPLVYSPTFSAMSGASVYLKLETMQRSGSFKVRGAANKILSERDRIGPSGVVAASAGNHAQGVALAAAQAGVPATIVMPQWVSHSKQQATKGYGAEVILHGRDLDESLELAWRLAEEGRTFVHPYNDPAIVAGQGTIALEVFQDLPHADVFIVPVGGGGLINGIATAAKALRSKTRIVGVQAEACPCAYRAKQQGGVVEVEAGQTIAEGIRVRKVGDLNYPALQELVDEVMLVTEDQIADAILLLLERKKVLAEGAGAAPLAALLSGDVRIREGESVVLIVSGGNLDAPLLTRIIRRGMFRSGRIARFHVCLADVPNELARLLAIVARLDGNVLHIRHARGTWDLPLHISGVELEVETRGFEHIEKLRAALAESGYAVEVDSPREVR